MRAIFEQHCTGEYLILEIFDNSITIGKIVVKTINSAIVIMIIKNFRIIDFR